MKHLIIKYLHRKLPGHPKHYHFLRWLAKIVEDKEATFGVLRDIGLWMSENCFKNKSIKSISPYQYSDIFVVGNTVYIYTYRPGNWIGKGGELCTSLENRLNYSPVTKEKINNYRISFIEETSTPFAIISRTISEYYEY